MENTLFADFFKSFLLFLNKHILNAPLHGDKSNSFWYYDQLQYVHAPSYTCMGRDTGLVIKVHCMYSTY